MSRNPSGVCARSHDVSADGRRLLMVKRISGNESRLDVVLNWVEELKRRVPAKP